MNTELTQTENKPTTNDNRAFAAPPVDIFESKEAFVILADLPGVDADSIKLDLERGQLTLEAARTDQALDYRRRFELSVPVDAEHVHAKLDAGVLRVEIPKAAEARPRTIPVVAS